LRQKRDKAKAALELEEKKEKERQLLEEKKEKERILLEEKKEKERQLLKEKAAEKRKSAAAKIDESSTPETSGAVFEEPPTKRSKKDALAASLAMPGIGDVLKTLQVIHALVETGKKTKDLKKDKIHACCVKMAPPAATQSGSSRTTLVGSAALAISLLLPTLAIRNL